MAVEGRCDGCPGHNELYYWTGMSEEQLAAALGFYASRRSYDAVNGSTENVDAEALEAWDRAGIAPDLQLLFAEEDRMPLEDGIKCAKRFFDGKCKITDEEWMEANTEWDPYFNPAFEDSAEE